MKYLLLSLSCLLLAEGTSFAAPTVILRSHRAEEKGEVRISLLRTGLTNGCSTKIYAAGSRASLLSRTVRREIFSTRASTEILGVNARSLPRSAVTSIHFQAETTCPDSERVSSNIVVSSFNGKDGTKRVGEAALINRLNERARGKFLSLSTLGAGLSFPRSLEFQDAGNGRFYIVRQTGKIETFEATRSASSSNTFLDITSRVLSSGERGLLGLAFHPNFLTNREFFVFYIAVGTGTSTISRFRSTLDGISSDPTTEEILLTIDQTTAIHKGGTLRFGPDGYLYISVGDGGPQGDPSGNGQSKTTLKGKILRINVDSSSGDKPYSIPSDNPFVGNSSGVREEIYAFGFRNPFKFSFDRSKGTLWAGDVGLSTKEEIDIVRKGKNYGWNIQEGTTCFKPKRNCSTKRLVAPIYEYPRTDGASVIGGYVYRGQDLYPLAGLYLFGDFTNGKIWALLRSGGEVHRFKVLDSKFLLSSFGEDREGEIYLLDYLGGDMFILTLR